MKTKKELKISDKLLELGDIAVKKIPSKQKSVRTTIRIPKEGHDAINRVSEYKQIKNAEVFNSILELAKIFPDNKINPDMDKFTKRDTIRKTYVMNKNTLSQLSQVAKQLNVSRDALISLTAELIDVLLDKELQERNEKYSKYLDRIKALSAKAEEIRKELRKEVADDDFVLDELGTMCAAIEISIFSIEEYVYEKTPVKKEG